MEIDIFRQICHKNFNNGNEAGRKKPSKTRKHNLKNQKGSRTSQLILISNRYVINMR